MINLTEALLTIRDNAIFDKTETIHLQVSLNRVASDDVFSEIDVVPFDYALFDGYAIRRQSGTENNMKYKVVHAVFAGDEGIKWIDTDCAVQVTTGAIVPENCDMVLKNENVVFKDKWIRVTQYPESGYGIARAGNMIKKNMKVVSKGETITPEIIEKLVMIGHSKIQVYSLIRVAVFNTGSELLSIGEPYQMGKIYPSNGFFIGALMESHHLPVVEILIAKDHQLEVMKQLQHLTQRADLIITTGGVGKGDKDLMLDSLKALGNKILFCGVDERGCKNVIFSRFQNCFILSLSGNPFAMKRGLETLGRPVLFQLTYKGEFKDD